MESYSTRMFGGFAASLLFVPASIMLILPTAMKFFGVTAIKAAAASATIATLVALGITLSYTFLAYNDIDKSGKNE